MATDLQVEAVAAGGGGEQVAGGEGPMLELDDPVDGQLAHGQRRHLDQGLSPALRVAGAIRAGTVWVTTYKQSSISTPFSGMKDSGLAVEKGRQGIVAYSTQKSIYLGLNDNPLPWAGDAAVP